MHKLYITKCKKQAHFFYERYQSSESAINIVYAVVISH